jgi:hypothetical protein
MLENAREIHSLGGYVAKSGGITNRCSGGMKVIGWTLSLLIATELNR